MRSLERAMRGIIMPSLGDGALAGLEQTEPVDMFAMMQQRALDRRHASRTDPWESQGREMLGSTAKVAELERQLEEAKAQLAQEDGERFRVLWREISNHEKARVLDGLTDRRERALFGLKALEKPKRLSAGRAGTSGGGLTCDKCGKSGLTKRDLALHTIRLHKASA